MLCISLLRLYYYNIDRERTFGAIVITAHCSHYLKYVQLLRGKNRKKATVVHIRAIWTVTLVKF